MNRTQIIQMALKAGFTPLRNESVFAEMLERFHTMAVAAEREACAKVAENYPHGHELKFHIGRAIRARGQA